jgi:hypothetical protein
MADSVISATWRVCVCVSLCVCVCVFVCVFVWCERESSPRMADSVISATWRVCVRVCVGERKGGWRQAGRGGERRRRGKEGDGAARAHVCELRGREGVPGALSLCLSLSLSASHFLSLSLTFSHSASLLPLSVSELDLFCTLLSSSLLSLSIRTLHCFYVCVRARMRACAPAFRPRRAWQARR